MRSRAALLTLLAALASSCAAHGETRAPVGPTPTADAATARATADALLTGPRIVFRSTTLDARYGQVAMVPLNDPGGPRHYTGVTCDRVYATTFHESCLRAAQTAAGGSHLIELDRFWRVLSTVHVPGLPSRTRLSPDGSLVATTTFVSGHAYMQVGFSTDTFVRHFGGTSYGDLESFRLIIDGRTVAPVDRNVWGVTFAQDDDTFFATVGTGGSTYLVKGSLSKRTLTAIHTNAECPSLSPDGTRVAYKVDVGQGQKWWTPAVLDLATGHQTVLTGESRNVDDQVEWLDAHTLLYGVPRTDDAGVDDVWALHTRADAKPRLLIKDAWSPAVVR